MITIDHFCFGNLDLEYISIDNIFVGVGMWGSGTTIFTIGILNSKDTTLIVCLMNLAMFLDAGISNGYLINHIELSPNFCGTLTGITGSFAYCGSVLGILTTGS